MKLSTGMGKGRVYGQIYMFRVSLASPVHTWYWEAQGEGGKRETGKKMRVYWNASVSGYIRVRVRVSVCVCVCVRMNISVCVAVPLYKLPDVINQASRAGTHIHRQTHTHTSTGRTDRQTGRRTREGTGRDGREKIHRRTHPSVRF